MRVRPSCEMLEGRRVPTGATAALPAAIMQLDELPAVSADAQSQADWQRLQGDFNTLLAQTGRPAAELASAMTHAGFAILESASNSTTADQVLEVLESPLAVNSAAEREAALANLGVPQHLVRSYGAAVQHAVTGISHLDAHYAGPIVADETALLNDAVRVGAVTPADPLYAQVSSVIAGVKGLMSSGTA